MSKKQVKGDGEASITALLGPLMAVIIGMIMVILDSTVVNVALPGLVEDFNSDLSTLQWTVTGYTLALSAVIPLAGWMTDRFGAKRIFLITIALFTIGSALCSFAQTPEQLIIYRIIQGLGGGMVAPIGMAMIFRLAPPDKMGAVMGMLGVPMLLAPALGPVLSGWLVEYSTWHWIFLINVPIGIIAILVGIRYLPNIERKAVPSLDILGIILAPIAFSTLAYAVNEGGVSWTSTQTVISLIVGFVALILFIIVELRQKQPLLELRVFGSSDFTRGIIITWISQIALFGSFVLIPVFLQQVKQFSPLTTGLILLPQALASAVFMPLGGRLFDKIGARPLAITGLGIITVALFMLSNVAIDTSLVYIMCALAMMGAGMGLSMMSINTHVLQAAPRKLVNRVTPLTTAAQQVMVSFAVAGLTGFLTSKITDHAAEVKDPLQASVLAFGDTFLLTACLAFVGALLGFILRRPKPQPAEEDPSGENPNAAMMVGH
ncbi:DHA2 family efflux MFS transporter permease subunit [Paenibacillus sedimenti]|uniref:DHA2 family efflux MFS transporter permease subunit n=1 Tax=Paenibacillus sedimenti TaxID=2770274 RepID=A0A926QMC1_9BACL|nr:DHA2 family efflux MFS transporter permease subunit [Paenibacillus sedimenti]MBD0383517.1 DHA2 family efflux MFS transporter permease subunit [Paenibacillus sedimenti]